MSTQEFVDRLNSLAPRRAEIWTTLEPDSPESEFEEIQEMLSFSVVDDTTNYGSSLLNAIFQSDVAEKSLDDFYFVPNKLEEGQFAYTSDDDTFYLQGVGVYCRDGLGNSRQITDSGEAFLEGMIACYQANIEFAFRRDQFSSDKTIESLINRIGKENAVYFSNRIKVAYCN
jgi:hypothetical protein